MQLVWFMISPDFEYSDSMEQDQEKLTYVIHVCFATIAGRRKLSQ